MEEVKVPTPTPIKLNTYELTQAEEVTIKDALTKIFSAYENNILELTMKEVPVPAPALKHRDCLKTLLAKFP